MEAILRNKKIKINLSEKTRNALSMVGVFVGVCLFGFIIINTVFDGINAFDRFTKKQAALMKKHEALINEAIKNYKQEYCASNLENLAK